MVSIHSRPFPSNANSRAPVRICYLIPSITDSLLSVAVLGLGTGEDKTKPLPLTGPDVRRRGDGVGTFIFSCFSFFGCALRFVFPIATTHQMRY